jgi:hypothetical protein
VDDVVKCATCNAAITNTKPETGIVIFFCQHVYHHRCLKSAANSSTPNPTATAPTPNGPPVSIPGELGPDGERVWCTICMSLQSKAKGPKVVYFLFFYFCFLFLYFFVFFLHIYFIFINLFLRAALWVRERSSPNIKRKNVH